jgi:hypothetical protein
MDVSCIERRGGRTLAALPALLVGLAIAPTIANADVGAAVTVASGLANPRGLDFAPNGALYVVEGGSGGPGPCIPSPPNPTVNRCYGETGAVTRVVPGVGTQRIVTGLPNFALPDGTMEGGPADISFHGTAGYVTMGLGGDPAFRPAVGHLAWLLGKILKVTPSGKVQVLADIATHESQFNPGGAAIDSNPYGSLALPGRRVTADAGANALIESLASGRTKTLAVLPMLPPVAQFPVAPRQPVPTDVVEGPDGYLYVSQLSGFPFWPQSTTILRVAPDGSSIETYATGFTAAVDLAFDAGGALYVLEIARGQIGPFPPPPAPNPGLGIGRLMRKCPGGDPVELLAGLTFAAGIAIGPDQAVYMTNKSTSATDGEILRLEVDPC